MILLYHTPNQSSGTYFPFVRPETQRRAYAARQLHTTHSHRRAAHHTAADITHHNNTERPGIDRLERDRQRERESEPRTCIADCWAFGPCGCSCWLV